MPRFNAQEVLTDLQKRTEFSLSEAKKMRRWSTKKWNHTPAAHQWSAAQCIAHLVRYGEYYIPQIELSLQARSLPPKDRYSPGFIGNLFANSMRYKPGMVKLGASANMSPTLNSYSNEILDQFIDQQKQILVLLQQARKVNVNTPRVSTPLSRFIKLKLADVLRVVVYHNERHIYQALQAAKN